MITSKLAEILYERQMKLVELSEETGISKDTLSGLFHNKAKSVDLPALEKICSHLNVDVGEVLQYDADKKEVDKDM
jgi:putative transcriptional regulator